MDILPKIERILFHPSTFFTHLRKEKGIDKAFKYLAVVLAFTMLAGFLVAYFTAAQIQLMISKWLGIPLTIYDAGGLLFFFAIMGYVAGLLGSFISAGILHIWIMLWGGKGNYTKTYQLTVYSLTPALVLGWIPLLGFLARIYDLILLIIGTSKVHDLSRRRAILMYVIPFVIFLILGLLVLFFVLFFLRQVANPSYFGM